MPLKEQNLKWRIAIVMKDINLILCKMLTHSLNFMLLSFLGITIIQDV